MANAYSGDVKRKLRASGLIYEEVETQIIDIAKAPTTDEGLKSEENAILSASERAQWRTRFKRYEE